MDVNGVLHVSVQSLGTTGDYSFVVFKALSVRGAEDFLIRGAEDFFHSTCRGFFHRGAEYFFIRRAEDFSLRGAEDLCFTRVAQLFIWKRPNLVVPRGFSS